MWEYGSTLNMPIDMPHQTLIRFFRIGHDRVVWTRDVARR
jgi:hypothetical protein